MRRMSLASLVAASLMGVTSYRMAEDAPAAPQTPAEGALQPAPATVTVEVPAAHETLVQRVLALLEKDATWLKDNIEAGLTHFEGLFGDDASKTAPEPDEENGESKE